jgi:hypothetical protein
MKERFQQSMAEMLADLDLDSAIQQRFKMERHPSATVDGDDPWTRDLFEEEPE